MADIFEERITARAIAGKLPSPCKVSDIRDAVRKLPHRFLKLWFVRDGRMEIVPGSRADHHPDAGPGPSCLGWSRRTFACVAGDHPEAVPTAIHEIAHCLDYALGSPSASKKWIEIWRQNLKVGQVPAEGGQRDSAAEYLAETFAKNWSGSWQGIPDNVRDFFAELVSVNIS